MAPSARGSTCATATRTGSRARSNRPASRWTNQRRRAPGYRARTAEPSTYMWTSRGRDDVTVACYVKFVTGHVNVAST